MKIQKAIIGIIVVALTIALILGYTIYSGSQKTDAPESSIRAYYSTQAVCEETEGSACAQQQCDYVPAGRSVEDVCGKDYFKGAWSKL